MRIFLGFIVIVLLFPYYLHSDENRHGWHLPHTPLYLSGYISTKYDPKEDEEPTFDDLALLLYANGERYHFLGEVELSDLSVIHPHLNHTNLYIERLRAGYDLDAFNQLTIGKFNSEIGFWNLARISILTDTTTAPYILEHIFPELTTGILYTHSFEDELQSLSLTIQHNKALDNRYNNLKINRHYAAGYTYSGDSVSWKFNGGYYRMQSGQRSWYTGIGCRMEYPEWTIQSELFRKQSEHTVATIPYDGYIQITKHLSSHHDLVLREERYKDRSQPVEEGISLVGLTYRPSSSTLCKGEYLWHTRLPKNRFVFSFSVLF